MRQQILFSCVVVASVCSPQIQAAERRVRTAAEAVALVQRAMAFMAQYGRERALAEMNKPKGLLVDGELYLFAFNANGDGISRANLSFPTLVGKNLLEMQDPDGVFLVKKFLEVGNSKKGSGWVDYKWPNPTTKFIELKTSYVARSGDLIIGCGIPKQWARK